MFFKSSPPNQPSEAEVLLENIPMASIPITQNQTNFNAGELVVGEGVVLNGSLEVPNKAWVLGAVNGDLKVHSLTVGSTGEIDGKVDCQLADIAGHVKEVFAFMNYSLLEQARLLLAIFVTKRLTLKEAPKSLVSYQCCEGMSF
jgi:cytoskeletal protein CcmA (bactofilin family)